MHGRVAGAAVAVVAILAAPAAAGAATKTVQAGPSRSTAPGYQEAVGDGNAYFRRVVTIRRGDRVKWNINGFHSVTFVPRGDAPPGLVVPDPTAPVAGVTDAAGAPFWFNGQPTLRINPLAALPQGGRVHDPRALISSGLPLAPGQPPPYRLRFRRTGTFRYLCTVHPGMAGKVRVVGRGRAVPSARRDRRAARREERRMLRQVQRLTTGRGIGSLSGAIQAGNDRRWGPTVFKFFPAAPAFRVGDTATLRMPPSSSEVHTFTFGPSNGKDAYNDQLAAGLLGEAFDPRGAYPSEPPGAVAPAYTGANHGNGFYNTGLLDSDPASPLPASTQVRFTTPGSFTMICLIHPFMRATVTVSP